jgi:dethiobiotin synthetase
MGSPPRGVFVTGTGTEVGKTVVAAAIARTLAAAGERVGVFKPCVTGLEEFPGADGPQTLPLRTPEAHRRPDHALLRFAAGSSQSDAEIAPYRYAPPASPHLAAAQAGEEIDPGRLLEAAATAATGVDALVCEGVGGLLVPLSDTYLVRDLAVDLGYPLVVASPPGLGAINHTLATLEVARAAGLEVAMVVLTPWPDRPTAIERSNRETIAALGEVAVELLPWLDLGAPASWPALALRP